MMSHEPRVDAPAVAGAASPRVPFSFEIYPPRTPEQLPALYETIRVLAAAGPRFISVTFGAGGSTTDRSLTVLTHILRETTVPPVAHVTCVGSSYAEATTVIRDFLDAGITRFLALRGDPPAGVGEDDIVVGDLESAAQLVQLIGRVQAEPCRSPTATASRSPSRRSRTVTRVRVTATRTSTHFWPSRPPGRRPP